MAVVVVVVGQTLSWLGTGRRSGILAERPCGRHASEERATGKGFLRWSVVDVRL